MDNLVTSLLRDARLNLRTADALPAEARPVSQKFPITPGHVHEWYLTGHVAGGRAWYPPLTVMTALACEVTAGAAQSARPENLRMVWIGRRCWPTFQLLCAATASFCGTAALGCDRGNALNGRCLDVETPSDAESFRQALSLPEGSQPGAAVPQHMAAQHEARRKWFARSIFLDPRTDEERFWAIGQALRCPAIRVVIADGGGMSQTVSRRLQLAVEEGAVLGLIARPAWELDEPTYAATRWEVHPQRADGGQAGWAITLLNCRGRREAAQHWTAEWAYQVFRGTGTLHVSPAVGRGIGAASGRMGDGERGGMSDGGAQARSRPA